MRISWAFSESTLTQCRVTWYFFFFISLVVGVTYGHVYPWNSIHFQDVVWCANYRSHSGTWHIKVIHQLYISIYQSIVVIIDSLWYKAFFAYFAMITMMKYTNNLFFVLRIIVCSGLRVHHWFKYFLDGGTWNFIRPFLIKISNANC